jgi:hypothetical protein
MAANLFDQQQQRSTVRCLQSNQLEGEMGGKSFWWCSRRCCWTSWRSQCRASLPFHLPRLISPLAVLHLFHRSANGLSTFDSLPLFPRIIEDFVRKEALTSGASSSPTLLSQTLHLVRTLRSYLFSFSSSPTLSAFPAQYDLTLLGGLLASLFSVCQFFISPSLGRLSDKYGRKKVLLVTMIGNLVSAALWLFADKFGMYALSRVVGGLSEGNVRSFLSS